MKHTYWIDTARPGELVRALLRALSGQAKVAIEADTAVLEALRLRSIPGSLSGPIGPFRREHGGAGVDMVILPLESEDQADALSTLLAQDARLRHEIAAIQIERDGCIEFMAGDSFHRECVSVGPSVPESLLRNLLKKGIIRGFHTPSETRSKQAGERPGSRK